jgi:hypothetical protein
MESTEKKIEDYLHFYIGCMIIFGDEPNNHYPLDFRAIQKFKGEFKIVLRPLSDMNIVEKGYYKSLGSDTGTTFGDYILQAERTKYLLSKGFDLFGLIDSGLAISKTTLTKK